MRCISLSLLLRFYEPHPAMLRGMARKEFRSGPLFICDEQREEAIFFYFNPLALWALQKHRGRGGLTLLLPILVFLTPLLVATLLSSPLYFLAKTQGRRLDTNNFLSLPKIVSVALESLFLLP